MTKLQQALCQQIRRLNDAERAQTVKEVKKALNEQRFACNKIEAAKRRLADRAGRPRSPHLSAGGVTRILWTR